MPGRYDRLTVNATKPADLDLLARFRELVKPASMNLVLLRLMRAWVEEQESHK